MAKARLLARGSGSTYSHLRSRDREGAVCTGVFQQPLQLQASKLPMCYERLKRGSAKAPDRPYGFTPGLLGSAGMQ
jgi:hypothetical protein